MAGAAPLGGRVPQAPRQHAALIGGHLDEAPHEGGRVLLQVLLQLPRQGFLMQPVAAQAGHDDALHEGQLPPARPAQHLAQPQLQRQQDLSVGAEEERPGLGG